jgi:hypothetical protein
MNGQVIIESKPGTKLLLVAVPKEAINFTLDEDQDLYYTYQKKRRRIQISDGFNDESYYEIIGLASQLTEEQAKPLGFKSIEYKDDEQKDRIFTDKQSIMMDIDMSGLILTDNEEALIIKIN